MLKFKDFVESLLENFFIQNDSVNESNQVDSVKKLLPYGNGWQSIIEACDALGNKTVLEREFKANWYALEVTSGPWTKGLMGISFQSEPEILNKVRELVSKFDFNHIIYTSHMSRSRLPGFYGERFIMVPIGKTKVIWSKKVGDIYSDLKQYNKKGALDDFPIDSYREEWPDFSLSEVLVDCERYYLVDPIRFIELADEDKKYPGGSIGKQRMDDDFRSIKTYRDLSVIIKEAINKTS